jgi:TPR repeat protein
MRACQAMIVAMALGLSAPASAHNMAQDAGGGAASQRDRTRDTEAVNALQALTGAPLVRRLEALSNAGNLVARWQLAMLLDTGQRGVQQNPDRARQLAISAAEGNEPLAWTSLGVIYATGRGGPVDYAASMQAYRRAAQLGERHGFFGVGVLYLLGQGVAEDRVTAASWFMASAVQGDEDAQNALREVVPGLSRPEFRQAVAKANEVLQQHGLPQRVAEQPTGDQG